MARTKNDEIAAQRDHFAEYENLAQMIGVTTIMRMLNDKGITAARVQKAFAVDRHLNSIPLGEWDGLHQSLGYGRRNWSLGQSVCVAKHVARHHLAGIPRP